MLRFFFRSLGGWLFGKLVSLISPLRKLTLGLALAMWLGILACLIGVSILWFYPIEWPGENVLDFFGIIISTVTGAIAYAAFKVKNYQDKQVEAISDIGHQQFSKVYKTVKEKWGKESNSQENEVLESISEEAETTNQV